MEVWYLGEEGGDPRDSLVVNVIAYDACECVGWMLYSRTPEHDSAQELALDKLGKEDFERFKRQFVACPCQLNTARSLYIIVRCRKRASR